MLHLKEQPSVPAYLHPSCHVVEMQAGVGQLADRAPWLEEWGGGASVENPHVQRVHYCELLVRTGSSGSGNYARLLLKCSFLFWGHRSGMGRTGSSG